MLAVMKLHQEKTTEISFVVKFLHFQIKKKKFFKYLVLSQAVKTCVFNSLLGTVLSSQNNTSQKLSSSVT